MAKRNFDGKRLFKFANITVIVLTLLFLNGWRIRVDQFNSANSELDDCLMNGKPSYSMICNAWSQTVAYEANLMNESAAVAIGLPVIYFGSVLFFRFIFPKSDKPETELKHD